jgi:hypothetical protein
MTDLKKYAITAAVALIAVYAVNNFAPATIKNAVNGNK